MDMHMAEWTAIDATLKAASGWLRFPKRIIVVLIRGNS